MADDTTLFIKDRSSLDVALNILDDFYKCSGLKLNKNKTEIFYLGNTNHRPNGQIEIRVVQSSFKALGITFDKDQKRANETNLNEKLHKFKTVLAIWSQRDLSLKGKITILKSLALPQLLYTFSVLYVPEDIIDKVDKMMFKFLWNGKPVKIKKTTIIADIQNGGLKMPDIRAMITSQKIMWMKRILCDEKSKWRVLASGNCLVSPKLN